jgi:hypothetical protein
VLKLSLRYFQPIVLLLSSITFQAQSNQSFIINLIVYEIQVLFLCKPLDGDDDVDEDNAQYIDSKQVATK